MSEHFPTEQKEYKHWPPTEDLLEVRNSFHATIDEIESRIGDVVTDRLEDTESRNYSPERHAEAAREELIIKKLEYFTHVMNGLIDAIETESVKDFADSHGFAIQEIINKLSRAAKRHRENLNKLPPADPQHAALKVVINTLEQRLETMKNVAHALEAS